VNHCNPLRAAKALSMLHVAESCAMLDSRDHADHGGGAPAGAES
jgi:hypothetical protein